MRLILERDQKGWSATLEDNEGKVQAYGIEFETEEQARYWGLRHRNWLLKVGTAMRTLQRERES